MISVIIPTRNRAELLSETLTSLKGQTLSSDLFEVLVVDNGSTDETRDVTLNFQKNLNNLRYVFAPVPGLHEGRHRGMKEARYELLVFADDDIQATPDWLFSYYEVFQDPSAAMAGGNNIPLYLEPAPSWLKNIWDVSLSNGMRLIPQLSVLEVYSDINEIDPQFVWGCNFAIRKKILIAAGGFHPDGMPKESIKYRGDGETHVANYVSQNNLKCNFHPKATVFHKVTAGRMTPEYFYQRGFSQGISDSYSQLRLARVNSNNKRRKSLKLILSRVFEKIRRTIFLELEAKKVLLEYKRGTKDGYNFHQECYFRDQYLKIWVHKSDYFSM